MEDREDRTSMLHGWGEFSAHFIKEIREKERMMKDEQPEIQVHTAEEIHSFEFEQLDWENIHQEQEKHKSMDQIHISMRQTRTESKLEAWKGHKSMNMSKVLEEIDNQGQSIPEEMQRSPSPLASSPEHIWPIYHMDQDILSKNMNALKSNEQDASHSPSLQQSEENQQDEQQNCMVDTIAWDFKDIYVSEPQPTVVTPIYLNNNQNHEEQLASNSSTPPKEVHRSVALTSSAALLRRRHTTTTLDCNFQVVLKCKIC